MTLKRGDECPYCVGGVLITAVGGDVFMCQTRVKDPWHDDNAKIITHTRMHSITVEGPFKKKYGRLGTVRFSLDPEENDFGVVSP